MSELTDNFNALPADYQEVLRLAQDTYNIQITPLKELKGGQTGAFLYLVSVTSPNSSRVQHLILKLDHKNKKAKTDEIERHSTAISNALTDFTENHIANLAYDRTELNGAIAIFYSIAGQSLHNFQSLASYQQQNKLEKIFSFTIELLLTKWNAIPSFEQAVHPQKLLSRWLGYRLQPKGNIEHFLENICNIPQSITGLMINGTVFPNPLVYAREGKLWGTARPIDTIIGFQHGDLNIGNILVRYSEDESELTGCYLIDFALFKLQTPLFYDNLYLEMSYLIRELSRVSFSKWVDFVTRYAEKDIVDPLKVPIELAGACSVINAGRNEFNKWVQSHHPSLSDDLWGQFWLAGVAAGLNFCNKVAIPEKERLASLVFAAAHLKHYHKIFGVALPVEVKNIDIVSESDDVTIRSSVTGISTDISFYNLPVQTTPFIGRQKEIASTREMLHREDVRLLTLTGPGGTGKTRLAIQTVTGMNNGFVDGIYFIDIAPIRDPDGVLAAIARTIGLRETSNRSLIDEIKEQLRNKKLLLLLDNFEQVTSAAPIVAELLQVCPYLKLLATSREALHIRGEHVFPVPSLSLPEEDFKKQSVEQLTQFESIHLFIERALAVKPDFEVTNENAAVVAGICSRLDGLPLAIELAAARIILFSPKDLFERVGSRFKLLKGGARDLPVRQQTLRNTIGWSYELLDIGEQKLFTLLSIFPSCSFNAVELIANGIKQLEDTGIDIIYGISSLIDKSLIRRIDHNMGQSRLQMLETIREYASERLEEDPDFSSSVRRMHAKFYADFTKENYDRFLSNEREEALKEIEPDIENIQIAWRYWVSEGDLKQLQKLTDFLWMLYDARGWYYATINLTTDLLKVLASTPSTPELSQQKIMLQMSLARVLLTVKGYTSEVEDAYNNALNLCKKYGEIPQMFPVLRTLASFYTYTSKFRKGIELGEQILKLSENLNDKSMRLEGHLLKGYSLAFSGNIKLGMEHLEKGISIYDPEKQSIRGFRFGNNPIITCHTTSALCLWMLGFLDSSLKHADESLILANKINHPFSLAYALFHTGLLNLLMWESEIALERAKAVLEISAKHEFQIWKAVATCLYGASLSGINQADDGLKEIKRGMEMYSELKTPPVFWPMLLLLKAGSLIQAELPKEGLTTIDEALGIIRREPDNPFLPEIYRIKGEVLLLVSPEKVIEIDSLFKGAMEIAKNQQTLIFELRAAISLCRLRRLNGKSDQVMQDLKNVYAKFTEGFTSIDLKAAKDLL